MSGQGRSCPVAGPPDIRMDALTHSSPALTCPRHGVRQNRLVPRPKAGLLVTLTGAAVYGQEVELAEFIN